MVANQPLKPELVNELPLEEQGNKNCKFCDRNEDNELLFGKFFTDGEELTAHYYCLLFASGLVQTDAVDEGILGFLIGDIEKELERGTKLTCSKCKKRVLQLVAAIRNVRGITTFPVAQRLECSINTSGRSNPSAFTITLSRRFQH